MKINRRQFTLGSTTLLLSGMLPLKVNSSMLDNKKNLVIIMLRGAMDGLTSVPYIPVSYTHLTLPTKRIV